jgi:hypothetical protein
VDEVPQCLHFEFELGRGGFEWMVVMGPSLWAGEFRHK